MKREHIDKSRIVIPDPYHWFPLTENANDVMGNWSGWGIIGSGNTYTSDGLFFNGTNSSLYKRNSNESNSLYVTTSVKTKLTELQSGGVYSVMRVSFGGTNFFTWDYPPDWSHVSDKINFGTLNMAATTTYNDIRVTAGDWFTFTSVQNFTNNQTWSYINGVKYMYFNNCISQSLSQQEFMVGYIYNNGSPIRYLKNAYLKDLRVWNTILTDEQISAL